MPRPPFVRRGPFHALTVMVLWIVLDVAFTVLGLSIASAVLLADGRDPTDLLAWPWLKLVLEVASIVVLAAASLQLGGVSGCGDRAAGLGFVPMRRPWLALVLGVTPIAFGALVVVVLIQAEAWWTLEALDEAVSSRLLERLDNPVFINPVWRWLGPMIVGMVVVVLGPISEELFFRGWLWTELSRVWSAWKVMLATAVPFLLMHAPRSLDEVLALLPAVIVLTAARHVCGSVRASAICHMLHNGLCFLLALGLEYRWF